MLHKNDQNEISQTIRRPVSQVTGEKQDVTHIRFQPTLILFLGTSSGQIAYRIKQLLQRAYGTVPVIRILWVDIDTDIDPLAQPWFTGAERIELSGLNPAAVIKNIDNYPSIKEWWPDSTQIRAGMLAGGGAPQQMRLIGRLALFRMFNDRTRGPAFIDRLRSATEAMFEIENFRATEAKSSDRIRYTVEPGCRVVLVHSTSGGTGSSMSFDVAYLCRHLLTGKNPTIISMSILPAVIERAIQSETQTQKEKVRANTYAWFKEDNFLTENPFWNVQYPEGAPVDVAAPPFDYRFVVDIENQAGYRLNSPDDIYNMVAQAIFLDTGSSIAGALRGFTANVAALGDQFEGMRRSFSSLAAASLIYPKERLLEYCASQMGHALLSNGLLQTPDPHQVGVATATLLSQLRLRDADLLGDLLAEAQIKMHYEPAIQKADSVSAGVTQVDAQENQNQAARRAETEKLSQGVAERLALMTARLDQEITRIAANQGLVFAQAVLSRLQEAAPTGMIDPNVTSLEGCRIRIQQQGATESDLQMAKREFEKAREALKKLDDGPEDVIERAVNRHGWNKKFNLFKRDVINAMNRLNELTLQLSAQQHCAGLYDQLAALAGNLRTRLAGMASLVNIASVELQAAAERLSSANEAEKYGYEFLQEIEVDFPGYYREHARFIDPQAVFQGMIPARAVGSMEALAQWTADELRPTLLTYARQFFIADLDNTSLLSVLQATAEKRGLDPQAYVEKQLDRLVEYCHPFWQYDKDRGLADLEGKSILGVEDENNPLIPARYRNGTFYELKTTGFRERIDVMRIQHGLPAFLIRGMDEFRTVYERKRKGTDPLHVLPGMEFARDLMPEQGRYGRELFAIALAFGYIVQAGSWYYFDPERSYRSHKIQPGREFRLAQGREKSEEVFTRRDEWLRKVDQDVESEVRGMGNDAAIARMDQAIESHKAAIARMPAGDESLRKQFEKEISAFQAMQRRLGKVG